MSRDRPMRRAVAEFRGDDASALVRVGPRALPHYWPLLSSYFRDVLLPPQRRADDSGVTWSWREPAERPDPSAGELRALRQKLSAEQQAFAESVGRGTAAAPRGGGDREHPVDMAGLNRVVADVVSRLVARSDADLAAFACRTENGWRLHSWGADAPARPSYPDTDGLEIAGRVLVGGRAARHDVVLESGDGETVAETPSDSSGAFRFPKLSPGHYRLRARTLRGTFPPNGLAVELKKVSVTDVVLSDVGSVAASRPVRRTAARPRAPLVAAGAGAAALAVLGLFLWSPWKTPEDSVPAAAATSGSLRTAHGGQPAASTSREQSQPTAPDQSAPRIAPPGAGALAPPASATPAPSIGQASNTTHSPVSESSAEARTAAIEARVSRRVTIPASDGSLPGAVAGEPGGSVAGLNSRNGVPSSSGSPTTSSSPGSGVTAPAAIGSPGTAPALASAASAAVASVPAGGPTTPAAAATGATPALHAAAPGAPKLASDHSSSPTMAPPAVASAAAPEAAASAVVADAPAATLPVNVPDAGKEIARIATTRSTPEVRASSATLIATPASLDVAANVLSVSSTGSSSSGSEAASSDQPTGAAPSPLVVVPLDQTGAAREAKHRVIVTRGEMKVGPEPLTRTVRVRLSPWRTRVLGDTILPTQPVRLKERESIEDVRLRLVAEQNDRLPVSFRETDARAGLVLELPAGDAAETVAWIAADGTEPAEFEVRGRSATVAWTMPHAPSERVYRLVRSDRTVVAEVRVEPRSHDFTLRTLEGVRPWLRLAVQIGATDRRPAGASADRAARYEWRAASGQPAPASWQDAGAGDDATRQEVRLALGPVAGAVTLQGCALYDRDSGWGLVTDVRQAADRPLGD